MHKTKKTIYLYTISLLLLSIIFVAGCSSSKKNPIATQVIDKQEDGLLFPALVKTDGVKKWGYINSKGDFAISPQFENAYDFQKMI